MSRNAVVALLLVLAAVAGAVSSGVAPLGGETDDAPAPASEGRVAKVVDGDTIHVVLGDRRETVRYIGIDTPETHHPTKPVGCYGPAASAYNERLVGGQRVRLVRDVEPRDRFGRLLAYVYRVRDGLFVNAELARLGYARTLPIEPDTRHAARLGQLTREARAAGRGLWSAC